MLAQETPFSPSPIRVRMCAAGIHLGVSALLASIVVLLIAFVWYPSPLFALAGGRDLFLLITGCDLVLGPLLTLVVFNSRKPRRELVRDVSIIACCQLAAMTYGLWTMLQARPVFIVYNAGQFNVTLANEVVSDPERRGDLALASIPWLGPRLVAAELPADNKERQRLTFSAIEGHGDVYQMPRYFVPYAAASEEVKQHLRSPHELAAMMRRPEAEIADLAGKFQHHSGGIGVLPLVVRSATALAVVDRDSGSLLGIEPLPAR